VGGVRVVLGEVEAALRLHPAVAEAGVVALRAPAGGRRLVAYVTLGRSASQPAVAAADLRDFVRLQVPSSMWPTDVFILDAMPCAPNGRLSLPDLPDPATLTARQPDTFRPPTTEMERLVAEVWAQALSAGRVSVTHDFFDLGGDSLRAQRMIAELERRLRFHVPMNVAFRHSTVGRLARELERLKKLNMTEDDELQAVIDGLSDAEVRALLDAMTHQSQRS
jgi:acyl carrier protein